MQPMYYIGLDVHKQKISYCVKEGGGKVFAEGWIPATRFDLDRWMKTLPQPWSAALEGYDVLRLDLRSLKTARSCNKSGTSLDAAGHRCCEKEERSHRRQQDLRLFAL